MPHLSVSWHRSKGYRYEVCRLSFFIPPACAFFENPKSMSKYNYASGAIHIDHHKDLNIDVKSVDDAVRLMTAFLAEDVTPVQEEKHEKPATLPFLVPAKLQELGVYTFEEFENKYREAVEGGANVLAPFLKKYRDLQVLDLGRRNKKETFEELKAFFGDQMRFGYTNFVAYF